MPEDKDKKIDERIKVLAFDNCQKLNRRYNEWAEASPPLHSCEGGGLGPGDYFAKTLIQTLPSNTSIGLVPLGLSGMDIDIFRKGVISKKRHEFDWFTIPPDDHWEGAYDWVIQRAKTAQKNGVIKGILFHQGESDNGSEEWIDKLDELYKDLKNDLQLDPSTPLIVGELAYDGCCTLHNEQIAKVPRRIPNAYVVSAKNLNHSDGAHFDLESQRELGRRYAELIIKLNKTAKPSH